MRGDRLSGSQEPTSRLGQLPLFQHLAPRDLRRVATLLDARHYRPRTIIFRMSDHVDRLYFLDQGIIKLSIVSPDGVERMLDLAVAGDVFGESLLSAEYRRSVSAESVTTTAVWTMAAESFMELLETLPTLCVNFVRHVMEAQQRAVGRLIAQMDLDRGVRLLAVLLNLAERCGQRASDDYTLPAQLTQSELAQMVGINRSTLSLLLNRYRRDGVLGGHGSVVIVHAPPARELLRKAGVLSA